jgi:hypothetical protein
MFARCLALVLSLTLALPLPAGADELFRAPAPDWAELLPVPAATDSLRAGSRGGVMRLMSDRQVLWSGEEVFTFTREVTEVTDPGGVGVAAAITVGFDPAFETVTLTHLDVIRAGQVIAHGDIPATLLGPPAGQGGGMTDAGADTGLTAALRVPGLQVGDIVDVGLLRRSLPRFPGDNRGGSHRIDQDVPVGVARLVLNWPADWPTYFSGWPARVAYAAAAGPDGTLRHTWTSRDHAAPPAPAAAPPGWSGALVLEWSADPDWSGIAAALADHYLQPYSLGAWDSRVEEIRARHATDAERAIAALRMVQDDLRTTGRPVGAGGLSARAPAEVIAAGVGDGKDKALLLRTMLDRLGIRAWVALTHRTDGPALNGRKPRAEAFDHAIVTFRVDGMTYWADPALTHQGGDIWTMVPPDYGFALPLDGPNRQALEPIPQAYTMQESRTVTEDYAFGLAGVHLSAITTFSGRSADDYRRVLADTPRPQIEADFRDHYAGLYPGLRQIAPLEVSDDRAYNTITLTARYFLPSPDLWAGGLIRSFPFTAPDFTADLPAAVEAGRVAPVWFGPLASYSHAVIISGTPIAFRPPAQVFVANEAWSYGFDAWEGEAGGMSMNWSFNRLRRDLPAAEAAPALADAQAVTASTFFTWNLRAAE